MGKIARHIPHYGVVAACAHYLRARFGRAPYALRPPGIATEVWLRPMTSDRNMFDDVFLDREYALDELQAPRTVLDCGANVGYTSVFLANAYPQARIVAVEPEPSNYALLCRNIAPYPNIESIKVGVWTRAGRLSIENPQDVNSGFRLSESDAGTVETLTIPDLLARHGIDQLDLLKLDVEGAERELLQDPSAGAWLGRTRCMVIELHERFRPGAQAALDAALSRRPHRRHKKGDNLVIEFQRVPA